MTALRSATRGRNAVLREAAHGLGLRDIDVFLAALASACQAVEVSFQWRPQLSVSNDEMVLETAVNGHADASATHNVRDFAKARQGVDRALTRGVDAWLRPRL